MSKKTISNQNPSNTINGLDLATTITSLQTQTTNITSNLQTITTILTGDQSEIDAIENILTGVPTLAGTNAFTSVNTFSSNPKTSSVASQNDDIPNKLYIDNLNATKVGLNGDSTIEGVKTFSSPPVIPLCTLNGQGANKQYVDNKFIGSVSLGSTSTDSININGSINHSSGRFSLGNGVLNNATSAGTVSVSNLNISTNATIGTTNTNTLTVNSKILGSKPLEYTDNSGVLTNNTLVSKQYVDNADNLKANINNASFTGTTNVSSLNVTTAVTLPSNSISDSALSTNIPKLNVENIFNGLRVNNQAYFNTLAPAMPLCTLNAQGANKEYVDTALNLKANLSNPTFTGTAIFTNAPNMSGANISNLSIPDSALSTNIPKLNSSSNNFTGGMNVRNATIGSENMAQTNTITGNTNIGSSNTNDVVNYIGKHNFPNSAIDAYKFNSLTCNGYSFYNVHPPECPIEPENDYSLTNKIYVDQLSVSSKSQPYLYTWSFGVGRAGATIVNNSLSTAENATRTVYMHIPTTTVALVIPFTVTFNYFFVFANQNQTVPASNSTLSYQTTFYYLYSQLNNTLYKSKEVGSTGTSNNQTFTSAGINYIYKPIEITAFTGATDKKGVMFKIGLPQMPNTASNGNYIMAFSSSLRIENSYSDDQFQTGRTTNDFIYPSADSKNEQGSVYFSYVAV